MLTVISSGSPERDELALCSAADSRAVAGRGSADTAEVDRGALLSAAASDRDPPPLTDGANFPTDQASLDQGAMACRWVTPFQTISRAGEYHDMSSILSS